MTNANEEHATPDRDANTAPPSGVCPRCGEDDIDQLIWDDDGERVTCQRCGTSYVVLLIAPAAPRCAAEDVRDAIRELASVQRQIADLLDAAGRKVRALEVEMSKRAAVLERSITRPRRPISAADVAAGFAEYRVNTGELPSRLIDAIEHRGHRVYPAPYVPIRSTWALIENRP